MKKTFRTVGIIAAVVMLSSCSLFHSKKSDDVVAAEEATAVQEQKTPKVVVAQVGMQKVEQNGTYTSSVQAFAVNNIAPQSSLRIKSINAEIGDFVTKGQVVARMDVSSLEQTKLQLINDSTELVRIKSLYEVGGVSKSDLDAIQLSYNVRKTTYENLLENTVLRSPITGVITARNYDRGDMYSMGQPIFTVQQITPVKLLVGISESDYTKVKKGDKVGITVDALPGETFEGTIERIYPIIDSATHTFTVEIRVPNANKRLRPGMYARVTVNFGVNNSVVIPDRALVRQQGAGDKFVYIYDPETKTVSYVRVTVGVRVGTECEILEGVNDGDFVVTEGQLRIKDGVVVEIEGEEEETEVVE